MICTVVINSLSAGLTILDDAGPLLKSDIFRYSLNNLVQSTPPVRNQETTVPVKGKP